MTSELIYHYTGEYPSWSNASKFGGYISRIQQYSAGVDDNDIDYSDIDATIIIGGSLSSNNASTVDPRLMELFSGISEDHYAISDDHSCVTGADDQILDYCPEDESTENSDTDITQFLT